MSTLKVTLASKTREYEFEGRDGEKVAMVEYQVAVTDENSVQSIAKLSRSAKKPAPQVGDEIKGTVENNEKYGPQIKEEKSSGGGGGRWAPNPERDAAIMRQNALSHATARAVALSQMMFQTESDKKAAFDLAKDYLNPSSIMAAADMFVLYSSGELKHGGEQIDESQLANQTQQPESVKTDDAKANMQENVDPNEIPF